MTHLQAGRTRMRNSPGMTESIVEIPRTEFQRGWPILLVSFLGVAVGLTGLPFYSYGLFASELEAEFGWTRSQTQLPMLFQTGGLLVMLPVVGWACDRYGARPVALFSMIGFAIAFGALALLGPNVEQFFLTVFLVGLLGAGTTPVTWTRAINAAFNKNRGVALGITLTGTGVTAFVVPILATQIIELHGWRVGFMVLAALPALLGIPMVALMFRENHSDTRVAAALATGLTLREGLRSYRFALIAIAFLVISFGIGGAIPNLFPLYREAGFGPEATAGILSLIGLSVIAGRLVTGMLLDRLWAPGVAAFLMCLPALSCYLLTTGMISNTDAVVATILLGLAAGAEFDIIAYLASRYFGMRSYSKLYSYLYIAFAVGAAIAPGLFGYVYDSQGSYNIILLTSAALFLIGGLSLLGLGSYPDFSEAHATGDKQ